jgi:sugar phosphate isomerase/epimerase
MTQAHSLKLGVTLHSFTAEWVSYTWSFEDLMFNVSQLGGGVEIVGPAHHRGFPHVPDEFAATFTSSVRRNRLTPTSYGSYADPFMRWDRELTPDELVAYTLPQLHGAARLGFPIVRLQNFAAEVAERLLPTAEKLGVRLGYELHTPLDLDSERTRFLVDQVNRFDTPYLGLIPDAGIFARSITATRLAEGQAAGLSAGQVAEVAELWKTRGTREQAEELIRGFGAGPQSVEWAVHVWGGFGHSDPADLGPIFRHVMHVHGKFFSMREGDEPDIRYRDLVFALLDNGYQGWISSEYEGEPADSFVMVAEQQAMIRRYAAEYTALHP